MPLKLFSNLPQLSEERIIATFWRAFLTRACTQDLIGNPAISYNSLRVGDYLLHSLNESFKNSIEYGSLYERIKDLFFPKERDGFDPLFCLLEIRRDKDSIILPVRRSNNPGENPPYISIRYEQVTQAGLNLLNFALIPIMGVKTPPQRQGEPQSFRHLSICRSEGNPH